MVVESEIKEDLLIVTLFELLNRGCPLEEKEEC